MVLGPLRSPNILHYPHSPENVNGDQGDATLVSHNTGPFSKAHPPDETGDVGTSEYNSNLGISPMIMKSKGDLISQVEVETINHAV